MKPREHELMCQTVEAGLSYGIRHFYKHREDCPPETVITAMIDTMADAVMAEIDARWRFDGDPDD